MFRIRDNPTVCNRDLDNDKRVWEKTSCIRDRMTACVINIKRMKKWNYFFGPHYSVTHLCLDPVFDHLHDGLHHFGILSLVDESHQDGSDERLAHVRGHRSDAVLDEIQTQDEQFAGNVAEVGRRRGEVLACHALKYTHERRYQSVDVARIVHARRLQDHQCAEELRRRTGCHSVPQWMHFFNYHTALFTIKNKQTNTQQQQQL